MNFVFVSPNFPHTYWNFCERLRGNGANVLGIGDAHFDTLEWQLKNCLTEYYFVQDMSDYAQMYRAVAYFACKYGKIDWLESNNEFWLWQDARLRTDFNITTGIGEGDIHSWKNKFDMKSLYAKGKIPTARCHLVSTREAAKKFAGEVGFPVIAKPNNGVGAMDTWKIRGDGDLDAFFDNPPPVQYVIEEFVSGTIYSYDAISDSRAEPLFEASNVFPTAIMDIVNERSDLLYYTLPEVPDALRVLGRRTLKAFGIKSRFAHLEFFRLDEAQGSGNGKSGGRCGSGGLAKNGGLGNAGDFVGLEVNVRPAGGYTTDMMNYAHSTDVYKIWADMVLYDKRLLPDSGDHQYCVYTARRDNYNYIHSNEEILGKYGDKIKMCERMPDGISATMGNQMYTARLESEAAKDEFAAFVLSKKQDGV